MADYRKILLLLFLFYILFFVGNSSVTAQGEIEKRRLPDNYNENTVGIKISSNGYGLDYRFSQRVTHRLRRFYEAEYNIVNSSKEIKVVNPYPFSESLSLRRFVFGKTHYVNNLKLAVGMDRMIFEKRDKNSISIHLIGSVGGSLGISKPIYYEIIDSVRTVNNTPIPYTSYRTVDVQMQNNPTDIVGRAPFKYGLDEIRLHPGITAKAAVAFDFSREPLNTTVLEIGSAFDYYFVPFEIMAGKSNYYLLSLYISYRFGRKYDANLNREARRDARRAERRGTSEE